MGAPSHEAHLREPPGYRRETNMTRGLVQTVVKGKLYHVIGFDIGSGALDKPGCTSGSGTARTPRRWPSSPRA